jgi:septal ring factor EnvC (AmiA/AmiB activator)
MKRFLILSLAITLAVTGLTLTPQPVAADVKMPTEKPRIDDPRCTVGQRRITNITETYELISQRRANSFTSMHEQAAARTAVLKQKGYDTKKLDAGLQEVSKLIETFRDKAKTLHDTTASMRDLACEDNEGAYKEAVARSRNALKDTRGAADEVHKAIRSNIIANLQAASTWLKEN